MSDENAKKRTRRVKYKRFGEYLNPDVALVQAGLLLDEAAFDAIESKDNKAMTRVSRGWMELGAVLHNITVASGDDDDDDEAEDVTAETRIMGFASPEDREVAESGYKDKG